jgi:hypothetical protein
VEDLGELRIGDPAETARPGTSRFVSVDESGVDEAGCRAVRDDAIVAVGKPEYVHLPLQRVRNQAACGVFKPKERSGGTGGGGTVRRTTRPARAAFGGSARSGR